MMAQHAGPGPALHVTTPQWVPATTTVDERMFTFTYRVARELGYSRRASRKLCRRIRLSTASSGRRPEAPYGLEPARWARAGLLTAIRATMGPGVDPARLEQALDVAVLADELVLLPPRQQAAVRWAVEERCTVAQIAERTGWKPQQIASLLREGLTTLTVLRATRSDD